MKDPIVFRTVLEMRAQITSWRKAGLCIGFVPTMGGLHDGHLALVKKALEHTDRVVVSIFVNPTQFGKGEDLENYPRTEANDITLITQEGGHGVFIPSLDEMYPVGFSTRVSVDGLTSVLCGKSRPRHFDGVTLIVSKLLNQVQADMAFFGEKDWQQLAVIRRMVTDLNIATDIRSVAIIRDKYGLALSSRNVYLDSEQIKIARQFNLILRQAANDIAAGNFTHKICKAAYDALLSVGFDKIDYIECRTSDTLDLVEKVDTRECRIFAAAYLGSTRLIDNHRVI